jgi:hypothetical protein
LVRGECVRKKKSLGGKSGGGGVFNPGRVGLAAFFSHLRIHQRVNQVRWGEVRWGEVRATKMVRDAWMTRQRGKVRWGGSEVKLRWGHWWWERNSHLVAEAW